MDENLSILMIDDEASQLESLKSFLVRRNFSVFTASNGEEGLSVASAYQIDLVINAGMGRSYGTQKY